MLNPKLAVGEVGIISGRGTLATERIEKGELLWELDPNASVISLAEWQSLPRESKGRYSQCAEDTLFLNTDVEYAWNHSCNPNGGSSEGSRIFALRAIQPGEEITFDYSFLEIVPTWSMLCACGSAKCRRMVSNKDYLLRELQTRYADHIPPYIQRAIERARMWDTIYHTAWNRLWRMRLRLFGTASLPPPLSWLAMLYRTVQGSLRLL